MNMKSASMEENPFTGKWRVVSVYANVVEHGWTLFKRYGRESFVWEFCEIGSVRFPVGGFPSGASSIVVYYGNYARNMSRRRRHLPTAPPTGFCTSTVPTTSRTGS